MNRRNILIVIGGVAVVVVIALLVAFSGGSPDTGSPGTEAAGGPRDFAPVEVSGQNLPVLNPEGGDLAEGMAAPTLSGTNLSGDAITIEPGGEPMVIIFLAHWCPHCQAEVPRIQEWIDDTGGPVGVELFGVATGTDPNRPNFPPADWLEREGFTPEVLLDDQDRSASTAYGLSAYPFWVMIDGEGNVAGRFSGELERDGIEQLFQQMQELG